MVYSCALQEVWKIRRFLFLPFGEKIVTSRTKNKTYFFIVPKQMASWSIRAYPIIILWKRERKKKIFTPWLFLCASPPFQQTSTTWDISEVSASILLWSCYYLRSSFTSCTSFPCKGSFLHLPVQSKWTSPIINISTCSEELLNLTKAIWIGCKLELISKYEKS